MQLEHDEGNVHLIAALNESLCMCPIDVALVRAASSEGASESCDGHNICSMKPFSSKFQ